MLDHFLDSTLLNDRQTTLREHCMRDDEARRLIDSLETPGSEESHPPLPIERE